MNPATRELQTNDTTPPAGTSLFLSWGPRYTTDALTKALHAPDWTKVDAYLPPEPRSDTSSPTLNTNGYVFHSTLSGLRRSPDFHTWPSHVILNACVQSDAMKNVVLVIEEARKTTDSELLSFVYDDVHAHIKAANFLYFSCHGLPPEPDLLEGYEQYQTANWDGRDAEPITAETLAYAHRLMKVMPTSLGAPDVAPAADGSIALEWIPESKTHRLDKLFLDIGPGEEWRAYWKLRNGEFRRSPNVGFSAETRTILKNIFDDLSA